MECVHKDELSCNIKKNYLEDFSERKSLNESSLAWIGRTIVGVCDNNRTSRFGKLSRPSSVCSEIVNIPPEQTQNENSTKNNANIVKDMTTQFKSKDFDEAGICEPGCIVDESPTHIQQPIVMHTASNFLSQTKSNQSNGGNIFNFTTTTQNNYTIINDISTHSDTPSPEISHLDQKGRKKSNFKQRKMISPIKKKVSFLKLDNKIDNRSGVEETLNKVMLPNLCKSSEQEDNTKHKKDEVNSAINLTKPSQPKKCIKGSSTNQKAIYGQKVGNITGFSGESYTNSKTIDKDKLSISINYKLSSGHKEMSKEAQKSHCFAIYGGHGGESVANFLQNNMDQELFADSEVFIANPEEAIMKAFSIVEEKVRELNSPQDHSQKDIDSSGSCALLVLNFNNRIYVANLGDSRAIISCNTGFKINSLSFDHKLTSESEKKRITDAGGKIVTVKVTSSSYDCYYTHQVFPGGLTVTRSLGDVNAKVPEFGGIEGVISPEPELISFDFHADIDFILMGSNGLFDKLNNKQITLIVLLTVKECILNDLTYPKMLERVTLNIINEAVDKESRYSISCIFLLFDNLFKIFTEKNVKKITESIAQLKFSTLDFENLYDDKTTKKYERLKAANTMTGKKSSSVIPDGINLQNNSSVNYQTQAHSQIVDAKKDKREEKSRGCFLKTCCGIFP